ncbi:hypothetical protein HYH03_002318 [Edaphochlamys debaryana]|uniref:AP2/ERF domain-containing protein n=1 Tax=Edaphochlamys debaryana TaxID=47281 RepID=A0A836C5T5_9CHLO|nr:hypothetical protein HYH03_002318 [Edaphochlamys debaryana]|eukprot:KAG2500037.1 hypothetical protein HYH03_002318 [Edaphochlamys debaryana]
MDVGTQPCPTAREEPSPAPGAGPLPASSGERPARGPPAVAAANSLRGVAGSCAAPLASAAVRTPTKAPAAAAAGGGGPGLAQPGHLGAEAHQAGGAGRPAVDDAVSQLRAARSRAAEAQRREQQLREEAEQRQRTAEVRQREAEAQARQAEVQAREAEAWAQEAEDKRWEAVEGRLEAEAAAAELRAQLQAAREEAAEARQQAAAAGQRAQEAHAQETASLQGQLAACQEQLAAAQSQADPLRLEVATLRDTCSRECSLKREHQKRAGQLQNQATAAQFRVGELMQQVTALEARRREAEREAAQARHEAARERAAAAEARSALQQSEARAAELGSAHARELQGAAERQQQLQSEACRLSGALRQRELELGRAACSTTALQTQLEQERVTADAAVSGANADVERLCAERAHLCSLLRQAGVQVPAWANAGPSAAALPSPGPQGLGGGPGTAAPSPLGPATPAAAGPPQLFPTHSAGIGQSGDFGPLGIEPPHALAERPSGSGAAPSPAEGPGLLALPEEPMQRMCRNVRATEWGATEQGAPAGVRAAAAEHQEEGPRAAVALAQTRPPVAGTGRPGAAQRLGVTVEHAAPVEGPEQKQQPGPGQWEATASRAEVPRTQSTNAQGSESGIDPRPPGGAAADVPPAAVGGAGQRTGWGLAARAAAPHAPQRGPAPLSAAAEHTQPLLLPALAAWGTQLEQQRQHTILLPAAQPCPAALTDTDARAPAATAQPATPAPGPQEAVTQPAAPFPQEAPAAHNQPSRRPQTRAQAARQAARAAGEAQTERAGKAKEATGLSGRMAAAAPSAAGTGRGSEEGSDPQPMEGLEGGSGAQAQAALGPPAAGGAGGAQAPGAQGPTRGLQGGGCRGPGPAERSETYEEEDGTDASRGAVHVHTSAQQARPGQGGGDYGGTGGPVVEAGLPGRSLDCGASEPHTPHSEGGPIRPRACRGAASGAWKNGALEAAAAAASLGSGHGGGEPQPVKAETSPGAAGTGHEEPAHMEAATASGLPGREVAPAPAASTEQQLPVAAAGSVTADGAEGPALMLRPGQGSMAGAHLPGGGDAEAGDRAAGGAEPARARKLAAWRRVPLALPTSASGGGCSQQPTLAPPGASTGRGGGVREGQAPALVPAGDRGDTTEGPLAGAHLPGAGEVAGGEAGDRAAGLPHTLIPETASKGWAWRRLSLVLAAPGTASACSGSPAPGLQPSLLPPPASPAHTPLAVAAAAALGAGSAAQADEAIGRTRAMPDQGVPEAGEGKGSGPSAAQTQEAVGGSGEGEGTGGGPAPLAVHNQGPGAGPAGPQQYSTGQRARSCAQAAPSHTGATYWNAVRGAAPGSFSARIRQGRQGPVVPHMPETAAGGSGAAPPTAAPGAAAPGRGSEEGSGPQPMEGLEGGGGAQAQAALGPPPAGGASGAQAPGGQGPAGLAEDTDARGLAAAGSQQLPLGVTRTRGGRFGAQIQVQAKYKYLGTYDTPEEAARAYDRATVQRHNEGLSHVKLRLNFPSEWSDPDVGSTGSLRVRSTA